MRKEEAENGLIKAVLRGVQRQGRKPEMLKRASLGEDPSKAQKWHFLFPFRKK